MFIALFQLHSKVSPHNGLHFPTEEEKKGGQRGSSPSKLCIGKLSPPPPLFSNYSVLHNNNTKRACNNAHESLHVYTPFKPDTTHNSNYKEAVAVLFVHLFHFNDFILLLIKFINSTLTVFTVNVLRYSFFLDMIIVLTLD